MSKFTSTYSREVAIDMIVEILEKTVETATEGIMLLSEVDGFVRKARANYFGTKLNSILLSEALRSYRENYSSSTEEEPENSESDSSA